MSNLDRGPAPALTPTTSAMAMAADGLSGAIVLGLVGTLAALGHDGLALLLGIAGGWLLSITLVAPHLHHAGRFGTTAFVARRFGRTAAVAAGLIAAMCVAVLLAAEFKALALVSRVAFGVEPTVALAAAAVAVVVLALAARADSVTRMQALLYIPLAAALAVPIVLPALAAVGVPVPQLTYGAVLQSIAALELKLLGEELADPVTLKAYLRPFTSSTPAASLLVTLSLALGLAVLPHLLQRPTHAASAHRARLTLALGFVFLLLAMLALPPLAAAARHGLLANLVGADVSQLPDWLRALGAAGLAQVCGVDAVSVEAVRTACAALPDAPTRLRLHDIEIARDATLLALPGLSGLPMFLVPVLAAAIGAAALAAAVWLVTALRDDLAVPGGHAGEAGKATAALATLVAMLVVVAAATWAATDPADLMTMLAWGLALAGAGLAPAVVAGIWWHRATAAGAVLGMLAGFALTAYYIVATRYFAVPFYETWAAFSNAGFGAVADFEAARDVWAAADGAERTAAAVLLDTEARRVANWWGLRSIGSGVLGAGLGTLVLLLVSAVTPRPSGSARLLIERLRGGAKDA